MQVKKHKPYGVYEKYVKSSVLFMVIFDSCDFS